GAPGRALRAPHELANHRPAREHRQDGVEERQEEAHPHGHQMSSFCSTRLLSSSAALHGSTRRPASTVSAPSTAATAPSLSMLYGPPPGQARSRAITAHLPTTAKKTTSRRT